MSRNPSADKRPPNRSLKDFGALSRAERLLLDAAREGDWCRPRHWKRVACYCQLASHLDDKAQYKDFVESQIANEAIPKDIAKEIKSGLASSPPDPFAAAMEILRQETRSKREHAISTAPPLIRTYLEDFMEFAETHPDAPASWQYAIEFRPDSLRSIHREYQEAFMREARGWRSVAPRKGKAWRIRADFIRFLALGGDRTAPVHERGIRISGAVIAGVLDLENAPAVLPLALTGCVLDKGLVLRGASLRGVDLSSSFLGFIEAHGAEISDNLSLGNGFRAEGAVNLVDAEIRGSLDCSGGTFLNRSDDGEARALDCDRIEVKGSVLLSGGFRASGSVRLIGAQIGGSLNCSTAKISNRTEDGKGRALSCDGVVVKGDVKLSDSFLARGEVCLTGAIIEGDIECCRATFLNRTEDGEGAAIACDRAKVAGDVFLSGPLRVVGGLSFRGARISGDLHCENATFDNVCLQGPSKTSAGEGIAARAVDLQYTEVGRRLFIKRCTISGSLDFSNARCNRFEDDVESWPPDATALTNEASAPETLKSFIILDGFSYATMAGNIESGDRLRWLGRFPSAEVGKYFRPQPWEQLIKVYRAMGHETWARDISKDKQRRLHDAKILWLRRQQRQGNDPSTGKPHGSHVYPKLALALVWRTFDRWVLGYGYGKARLALMLTALFFGCAQVYTLASHQGLFVPKPPVLTLHRQLPGSGERDLEACRANWTNRETCRSPALPREHPSFSPHLYSADLMFPLVSFGQEDAWVPLAVPPDPAHGEPGSMLELPFLSKEHSTWWLLRAVTWIEVVLGWLLSFLLVGVLSGFMKKD